MEPRDKLTAPSSTGARFGILVIVGAILRAPSFFRPLMDIDEGCYAAIAARMVDGGLPYRDGVENKVPGVYYAYYWVFRLFGRYDMLALHLTVALVALATALVCGRIARRLYRGSDAATRDRIGFYAALLYVVYSTFFYPKMLAANTEMFLVLPAALALWAYLAARRHPALYLAAGACMAVAFLFKQVAFLLFAGLCADSLVALVHKRATIGRALATTVLLLFGFVAVVGGAAAFLAARGILHDAIFWSFTYIFRYYLPAGSNQHAFLLNFVSAFLPFLLVVSPLLLPALPMPPTWRSWRALDGDATPVWLWLAASAASSLIGGRMYGHYFVPMIPPLSVLAAVNVESWLAGAHPQWRRRFLLGATTFMAVGFCVWAALYETTTASFWSPKPDYRLVTDYVRQTTRPDERIFVWGWFPALYVEADRSPSTRFVTAHILAGGGGHTGGGTRGHRVEEGWSLLMDDLTRDPPPVILDTSAGDYGFEYATLANYPPLDDFVRARYREERTIAGVRIFRRQ